MLGARYEGGTSPSCMDRPSLMWASSEYSTVNAPSRSLASIQYSSHVGGSRPISQLHADPAVPSISNSALEWIYFVPEVGIERPIPRQPLLSCRSS